MPKKFILFDWSPTAGHQTSRADVRDHVALRAPTLLCSTLWISPPPVPPCPAASSRSWCTTFGAAWCPVSVQVGRRTEDQPRRQAAAVLDGPRRQQAGLYLRRHGARWWVQPAVPTTGIQAFSRHQVATRQHYRVLNNELVFNAFVPLFHWCCCLAVAASLFLGLYPFRSYRAWLFGVLLLTWCCWYCRQAILRERQGELRLVLRPQGRSAPGAAVHQRLS
jgi:hypothetical protein